MSAEEKDDKEAKKKAKLKKKRTVILIVVGVLVLTSLYMLGASKDSPEEMKASVAGNNGGRHRRNRTAREYEVKFLDSLDVKKVHPLGVGGNRQHWAGGAGHAPGDKPDLAISGRLNAAYRLGMAFASMDDDAVAQRERLVGMVVPSVDRSQSNDSLEKFFYDCVGQAESDNERGIAAIMMSGYYFGSLCTVLEFVDNDSKLPDEKILASGIKKMDNLKEYLNAALTAEREVKTTMAIQRLEVAADSVEATYYNCQAEYGENGPKYDKLLSVIKSIDGVFR